MSAALETLGVRRVQAPPFAERGDAALVGIVDDGIDVLHSAFLDGDGRTRILRLWDQTADRDPAGDPANGVLFGKVYGAADLDGFIARGEAPRDLSSAHGTHVASIAAGSAAPAGAPGEPLFAGGVAPEARLVIVKPRKRPPPGDPFRIGSSSGHIFALSFLGELARELGLPVVVNLSLGMNAGSHDGTTLLETAIDDFTSHGMAPGRVVVKSAGNERDKESRARIEMRADGREFLTWNSRTVARDEDLIELWFKAADDLSFRLHQPSDVAADASEVLNAATPSREGTLQNGNRYRLTYVRFSGNNGDSQVLLTISPGTVERIAGGDWKLEIVSGARVPSGGRVDAWLERNDRRPIRFKGDSEPATTLTIPGTSRTVLTVGAGSKSAPFETHDSSSMGPTRDGREKPELMAPGIAVEGARAGTGHLAIEKTGTSQAAAHVTGAVALLLSHRGKRSELPQWNAVQMAALLTQFARGYDGRWRPDSGYGMLDVGAVFEAV